VSEPFAPGTPGAPLAPQIEIADLVWRPAGAERATLDLRGIRVSVPAGGLLIICGPSGAGKTTLLRAIAGLLGTLIPGEIHGTLVVGGVDIIAEANGASEAPREHLRGLGYLAAGPAPTWALPRLADDAALPLEARRLLTAAMRAREAEVALRVGLAPSNLERAYGTLSGGERTIAAATVALVAQPTLLLADEPLLGLDPTAAATLRHALLDQRATRVIALHDRSDFNDVDAQVLTLRGESTGAPVTAPVNSSAKVAAKVAAKVPVQVGADLVLQLINAAAVGRNVGPLHLKVRRGEAVVISGVTGSGKSTVLGAAAGTLPITRGERVVDRATCVRLVPQDPGMLIGARPVRDQIMADDHSRADSAARALGVAHLLDALPGRCSDGERRRLALVLALSVAPDLLIADEPTGGLDDARAADVCAALDAARASGSTLLIATHDPRLRLYGERRIELALSAQSRIDVDAAERLLRPAPSEPSRWSLGAPNPLTRAAIGVAWLLAALAAPPLPPAQLAIAVPALVVALLFGARVGAVARLGLALAPAIVGLILANLLGGAPWESATGSAARMVAFACGSIVLLRPFEPLRLADAAIERLRAPFAPTIALLATAATIPNLREEARERRAIRRLARPRVDPFLIIDTFDALVRAVPTIAIALEVRGVRLSTRAEPPTRLRPSTFGRADAAIVASAVAALTVALLIGAIVGP
jgi:ABC-type lipoprotein export system ATPase subunit